MDKESVEYFMTKMTQAEFEAKIKGHKIQPYIFNQIQPERSKREDSCKHQFGSEQMCDSSDPYYICSKCGYEMRCSEHHGNMVREVQ